MKRVELLWFAGCPNHVAALEMLRSVVQEAGVDARIESIHVDDDDAAMRLRFPGSPTIRVDGVDVEPGFEPAGAFGKACRVYMTAEGMRGLPERQWVMSALQREH